MKQLKCESCFHRQTNISKLMRPPYANARYSEPHDVLTFWCYKKSRCIAKFISSCEYYLPDPKKVQKIQQKRFKQCTIV